MTPVAIFSRPEVAANRGQVAFRRGPIIYCLEKQDAAGIDLEKAVVVLDRDDPSRTAKAVFEPTLGLHVLTIPIGERRKQSAPKALYYPAPPLSPAAVREVTLIPFWFRANRGEDTRWITFIPY
jgi:DUF1680 family protein